MTDLGLRDLDLREYILELLLSIKQKTLLTHLEDIYVYCICVALHFVKWKYFVSQLLPKAEKATARISLKVQSFQKLLV